MTHSLRSGFSPLDLLTAEQIAEKPPVVLIEPPRFPWWEKFQYDLYDWEDPEWRRRNVGPNAWLPVRLTKGYFAAVSVRDHKKVTAARKKERKGRIEPFFAKIQTDRETGEICGVYAHRRGTGEEPTKVLLHRELLGCIFDPGIVGEHCNGWGLDNRLGTPRKPINLRATGYTENNHNCQRFSALGLLRGVEHRGDGFCGKRCIRLSKTKVVTVRSKKIYATQEEAHEWYMRELNKLYRKRTQWSFKPKSVSYPDFPRLLQPEKNIPLFVVPRSSSIEQLDEVPF